MLAGADGAVRVARDRPPRPAPAGQSDPTASSVHVNGSSRKSAYVHVCSTSAAKHAAIAIRGGERPAPRNRTRKAATSSATYTASPMIPCSAATVIGIVCDADTAFSALACAALLWSLYSVSKDPEP